MLDGINQPKLILPHLLLYFFFATDQRLAITTTEYKQKRGCNNGLEVSVKHQVNEIKKK